MEQNTSQNRKEPDRKAPASARSGLPVRKEKAGKPTPKRWELTHKKIVTRSRLAMFVLLALLFGMYIRFAVLQLVDPNGYAQAAVDQYTYEVKLEAKRGTIYASDGKTKLAISATTQTVFISPADVYKAATESTASSPAVGEMSQIRKIAYGLAECLDNYDPQTLIDKYNKLGDSKTKYKYLIVKKDISEDEEARVRAFISENGLERQIALEEGSKRFYPYSTLAAQVIGFVGSDNSGLGGIEYFYNSELSGIDGKAVRAQDANGNDLAYNYETYIEAQDGLNLVTTIDWTIQSVVEKYIEQTYRDHQPEGRVSCIVMDVNTGEILAMAIYPNFDLNHFTTLSTPYQAKLDEFVQKGPSAQTYDTSDPNSTFDSDKWEKEKDAYRTKLMNEMWNNTIVSQTYEPGSTFKLITAAMALETGAITREAEFNCGRSIELGGEIVHCHSRVDHGMQTVAQSLVNSCNPAFARIGLAVKQTNFKRFFAEFGYTQKTGIDLPGEVSSIYYDTTGAQFEDLELAVYSFGQTFKVTMLQHIAALSSVANGGHLVTPHIGKYLTDQNGNIVKTFTGESSRQVVSEQVCNDILSYLVNSTINSCVNGYNVVSKTGTSEKRDTKREDDYISSCVTFAPAEDPQIAVLVTVDTPTGSEYYGSKVAAPAVGQILTEVLPYLGIAPDQSKEDPVEKRYPSDYVGSKVADAKAAIEQLGLKCVIKGSGTTVTEQMPRADVGIVKNGTVILYTEGTQPEYTVSVPDVRNATVEAAIRSLQAKGLNVQIEGVYETIDGYHVGTQSIAAGEMVAPGTVVVLHCRYSNEVGD